VLHKNRFARGYAPRALDFAITIRRSEDIRTCSNLW
jgi:hypothetical protein